ncbi:uncharacterized protein LOC120899968 isoform X3 [Anopheles arabiensis]|uniref:uncharacterized protein LOC120899968 isoform X3 n=1 Tax=Anopheles arabiensis TaxID=7173 RepID=UPI001AAD4652|nr:uncharacterized protein LOC120899968 isoform X3 [Anopheles arabiensis]
MNHTPQGQSIIGTNLKLSIQFFTLQCPLSCALITVIREQYWTWSCRCRRELTPREKALLIVIFILVLVIGGLATYLGIVVDSDDGITGGILTRSMLEPATTHQ